MVQHIHTARGTCSTELLESQAPTQLGAGDGCCGQPEPAAHDAPGCTASHTAVSDAAGLSPLRSVLESCGLGFPALMAVLKYGSKQNLDADRAGSHVQQLQQWLGPDMVNQMLLLAPLLVDRSPALLQKHYSGLAAVLGGDASLVQAVVRKLPDILNHSPDAISSRVAALQDIFQVRLATHPAVHAHAGCIDAAAVLSLSNACAFTNTSLASC